MTNCYYGKQLDLKSQRVRCVYIYSCAMGTYVLGRCVGLGSLARSSHNANSDHKLCPKKWTSFAWLGQQAEVLLCVHCCALDRVGKRAAGRPTGEKDAFLLHRTSPLLLLPQKSYPTRSAPLFVRCFAGGVCFDAAAAAEHKQ